MKKLLLATVFAMPFVVSTAFAADLPSRGVAPYAPVPTFTWTGFYIGANGGFGGGEYSYPFNFDDEITGSAHLTSSGFLGGGQVGFNWQIDPNFVIGAEADIDASWIKGQLSLSASEGPDALAIQAGSKTDWFGTVRGRLGWLLTPQFLVYGTAGLAFGETKSFYSYDLDSDTGGGSVSKTKMGWTAGAGAEYALNNHWSFKAEYLYVDLGKNQLLNVDDGLFTISAKSAFNVARVGLNYKF